MNIELKTNRFVKFIEELYPDAKQQLSQESALLQEIKDKAFCRFVEKGIPTHKDEKWAHRAIDKTLEENYSFFYNIDEKPKIEKGFHCEIKDLNSILYNFIDGWYSEKNAPLHPMENGIIVGSLRAAIQQYPELVFEYLGKQSEKADEPFTALNTALFTDGLFLYVPENVTVEDPFQLISLISCQEKLMVQTRHLIILKKNSKISFIQCDDSVQEEDSIINNVVEIFVDEGATIDYYKMENKAMGSLLLNHTYIAQQALSKVHTHSFVFNGNYVRNEIAVQLMGSNAEVNIDGLYLVDSKQYVDNQVFVGHQATGCRSFQHYKGIVDDEAGANFNGYVRVNKDAQQTEAHQTNRNIMLTDEATITTQPFLEIHADDVKCSHGATIGQLDENAMYYLRTRGIGERNARMLLMVAFANEIADKIAITPLQTRLKEMIRKRLRGELSGCDNCAHCR